MTREGFVEAAGRGEWSWLCHQVLLESLVVGVDECLLESVL